MPTVNKKLQNFKIPDGKAPAKLPSNFLKNVTGTSSIEPRIPKISRIFNTPGMGFARRI